jgi:hypothetical protein
VPAAALDVPLCIWRIYQEDLYSDNPLARLVVFRFANISIWTI